MINPISIIGIFFLYMGLLFAVALFVERRSTSKHDSASGNPIVYSLSLAVYCSSWTYYGSVGSAATSGLMFLTIYLGPTLSLILWCMVLRKLIHIKSEFRITSIADLISARYDRSHFLAALVTIVAILGTMPYVALQLKSIITTFDIISMPYDSSSGILQNIGPLLVLSIIIFTIAFGVRKIDPTERHQGMVTAVAIESIVKLVAFLAAGIFVTYFIYDGFGDIFQRLNESSYRNHLVFAKDGGKTYITWASYLILAMSAILFLPRQFHISVVENSNEKHILTAIWLFPLYMLLINIFVIPIAMGGVLKGIPLDQADTYVLQLPMASGQRILTLIVFIGGFSAAMSMIMISSMTVATMITNHLLLPVVERIKPLSFFKRYILQARWVAVALFIYICYAFECHIGESYMLVNIGIISFAAALQFAPAVFAGIFFRGANKAGAILGLGSGFVIWLYTMLLPSFIKSGWISQDLLHQGLLGIQFLKPEQLFGLSGLDPVSHTVFWSMFFNIGFLVFGSFYFNQSEEEKRLAELYVERLPARDPYIPSKPENATIDYILKKQIILEIFSHYFSEESAERIFHKCEISAMVDNKEWISINELAKLVDEVEKTLTGSFGAAVANSIIIHGNIYTVSETKALRDVYSDILAKMYVNPAEFKQKIDYYLEREKLLYQHSLDLKEKIAQRDLEIVERKKIEEALQESEEKYRLLVENATDGIFIAQDEVIKFPNPKTLEVLGYTADELIQIKFINIIHPEDRNLVLGRYIKRMNGEDVPNTYPFRVLDKACKELWVQVNAVLITWEGRPATLNFIRDITSEKKLELQLQQTQKMEAIGTLAGGIAHDFNNILGAIMGYTEMTLDEVADNEKARRRLEKVLQSGRRATDLVKQILTFSRRSEKQRIPINVSLVISEVLKLLRATLPSTIEIREHFETKKARISSDPTQIHQVMMNLCTNAKQAMHEKGGVLEVLLENVNFEFEDEAKQLGLNCGDYLKIVVKDTGHGIPTEVMDRIFEPFYTTKPKGEGTGLGLSVVHGIVEDHEGAILVDSEVGKGTTFQIFLPLLDDRTAAESTSDIEVLEGSETILLVDDEEILAELYSDMLSSIGYKVVAFTRSKDALIAFQENPDKFDLVLTDYTMPDLTGIQLAEALIIIRPDLPIILYTGFAEGITVEEVKKRGVKDLLSKPLIKSEISATIRKYLE